MKSWKGKNHYTFSIKFISLIISQQREVERNTSAMIERRIPGISRGGDGMIQYRHLNNDAIDSAE